MARRVAVLLAAIVLAACRQGGAAVRLDGSPRLPDDQGVVTAVSRSAITLDGRRHYAVSPKLMSFSTYTLQTVSVFDTPHKYVQIGLRGHTMTWIATIAAQLPTQPPTVYYQGTLRSVSAARHELRFGDGTVLRYTAGLRVPRPASHLLARIDPGRHVVVSVSEQRS